MLFYLEQHLKYADESDREFLSRLVASGTNAVPIDMLEEVEGQMSLLQTLRLKILRKGVDADFKDLKDLISLTTPLLKSLTQLKNDIINQTRIRVIQEATEAAIGGA